MIPAVGYRRTSVVGDQYFANVVLLLHMETNTGAGPTDSSSYAHAMRFVNTGGLSTAQQRFGTSSLVTTGSGYIDPVTSNAPEFQLHNSEFTCEFWMYPTDGTSSYALNMAATNTYSPLTIIYRSTGLQIEGYSADTSTFFNFTSDTSLPLNAWTFVQVRRTNTDSGDIIALAINGTQQAASYTLPAGTILYQTLDVQLGGAGGVSYPLIGALDEFRLTMGVARPFNLPTAAFPNFASGYSADILMHFNGINGSTVFTDVGSCLAYWTVNSGSPHLSTASPILGSSSLALSNGIDGIKTATWPVGLDLSGEFTITFKWTCPDANTKMLALTSFQGSGLILIAFFESNAWHWYAGVYGATDTRYDFTDIAGYVVGQTYEIAFSRDPAGVIRFARDGVISNLSFTDNRSWTQNASLFVGAGALSPYNPVGVIDELMIINKCLFTTSYVNHTSEYVQGAIVPFTLLPPPPPVGFLLHFEGSSIVDSGTNALPVTNYGATLVTTPVKFGTQALGLSGGFLRVSDDSLIISTRDFTVDCWVYFTAFNSQDFILDTRTDSSATSGFAIFATGSGQIFYYDGTSNLIASSALSLNQWYHIQVGRSLGTVYLFINGVLIGTATDMNSKSSNAWVIAAAQYFPPGVDPMIGYMDEFHAIVGTCLNTTSFTPPSAPYS